MEVEPSVEQLALCLVSGHKCHGSASSTPPCLHEDCGSGRPASTPAVVDEEEARRLSRAVLVAFHVCRGLQQSRAGQLLASTTSLCEALKLDPSHSGAWRARAEAWGGLGVPALALRNMRMAARCCRDPSEGQRLKARCTELEDDVLREGLGPELTLEGEGGDDQGVSELGAGGEPIITMGTAVERYEEASVLFQEGFFKAAARRYLACLRALDTVQQQQQSKHGPAAPAPPPAHEEEEEEDEDALCRRLRVACLLSVASTCVQRCSDLRLAAQCCDRVLSLEGGLSPGHPGALVLREAVEQAWQRPTAAAALGGLRDSYGRNPSPAEAPGLEE